MLCEPYTHVHACVLPAGFLSGGSCLSPPACGRPWAPDGLAQPRVAELCGEKPSRPWNAGCLTTCGHSLPAGTPIPASPSSPGSQTKPFGPLTSHVEHDCNDFSPRWHFSVSLCNMAARPHQAAAPRVPPALCPLPLQQCPARSRCSVSICWLSTVLPP